MPAVAVGPDGRGDVDSRIGAIMNAATARRSSMMANTRWRAALRSEKPAMNSAGVTEAPTPTPIRPVPTSATMVLGGMATAMKSAMPALRQSSPNSAK